jgi:hypothetical protein
MFCAFEGKPLILRLHGWGEVFEQDHPRFAELATRFPALPAVRSIVHLSITRIADSCGWTVPLYEYAGTRDHYDNYAASKGPEGIRQAQLAANLTSIDGLPGLAGPSR